jgi:signal transduction histidine kinase
MTEPAALALVAVLLLAIATAQYRSVAAWGDVERERGGRRWNEAAERAAGELNASLSDLYAAVVAASQRNGLADDAALAMLFDGWRARTAFGSFVEAVGEPPQAAGEIPFVATWTATADGLPSLRVSLPPGGTIAAARFTLAPRACERMREAIAKGRLAAALPDVELAITPADGPSGRGCVTSGYDAARPPEASAAVFRLGLRPPRTNAVGPAPESVAGVMSRGASLGLAPRWQLQLQRRGGSLAATIARSRQRTLWATAASELLLIAAVAVIALGGWRAHRRARAHLAMAAAVAHELRTPLAALKVLGQNQARGIVTGERQLAQYGQAVASEADRLHAFVERVLQFASGRAGTGPAALAPIDCERLAQAALDPLRDRVRQAGLDVRLRLPLPPPRVFGDEPSLVLALRNLLQNVLDHAEGARHVELTVAARVR